MSYSPFPPANGTPGSAAPSQALLVGGSDGTDLRALSTDGAGNQNVVPPAHVLLATTAESITSTVTTLSETAGQNGQCVVVAINCASGKTMAFPVAVRVRNTTNGIICNWQISPIQIAGGSGCQLYFNLPVSEGDTVDIDVIAQGTVGSAATDVTAVLSSFPVATDLRPDGRSKPLGTQWAEGYQNGIGSSALAAGISGWRFLVHSVTLGVITTAASSFCVFRCTVNASSVNLPNISGDAIQVATLYPPTGILCDVDTALTALVSNGPAGVVVDCLYDVVPE